MIFVGRIAILASTTLAKLIAHDFREKRVKEYKGMETG